MPKVVGTMTREADAADAFAGSPAGADRSLQYNNAGSFGSMPNHALDASSNVKVTFNAATTTPGNNALTYEPDRVAAAGGNMTPRYKTEDGKYTSLSPHWGKCKIALAYYAPGGTALTTLGALPNNISVIGTNTIRTPDATTRIGRSQRFALLSAATAGAIAGWHNSSSQHSWWTVGGVTLGGFKLIARWSIADAAAVAGAHMFIGMRNSIAAPSATTSPAAYTNSIGVAQVNGSANLQMVYGGSAGQAAIDLGANFPAATVGNIYELTLFARPDISNQVAYKVKNITTGNETSGILTGVLGTALPTTTTLLGPAMYRTNNATALAVVMELHRIYIESDWEET